MTDGDTLTGITLRAVDCSVRSAVRRAACRAAVVAATAPARSAGRGALRGAGCGVFHGMGRERAAGGGRRTAPGSKTRVPVAGAGGARHAGGGEGGAGADDAPVAWVAPPTRAQAGTARRSRPAPPHVTVRANRVRGLRRAQ